MDDRHAGRRNHLVALGILGTLHATHRAATHAISDAVAVASCRESVAQSRAPVLSIALDVGHESEAAFTRAFKRLVGTPPATWRRIQNREQGVQNA
jgi:transcriptional regulator GlxA family with amidase domain